MLNVVKVIVFPSFSSLGAVSRHLRPKNRILHVKISLGSYFDVYRVKNYVKNVDFDFLI